MTTQDDKAALAVEPEWASRQAVADMLAVSPSTVTRRVNEWVAAGKEIPRLGRNYHLASVRQAAIEAGLKSY